MARQTSSFVHDAYSINHKALCEYERPSAAIGTHKLTLYIYCRTQSLTMVCLHGSVNDIGMVYLIWGFASTGTTGNTNRRVH